MNEREVRALVATRIAQEHTRIAKVVSGVADQVEREGNPDAARWIRVAMLAALEGAVPKPEEAPVVAGRVIGARVDDSPSEQVPEAEVFSPGSDEDDFQRLSTGIAQRTGGSRSLAID